MLATHLRTHPFSEGVQRVWLREGLNLAEMVAAAIGDPILRRFAVVRICGEEVPAARWASIRPKAGARLEIAVQPAGGDAGKVLRTVLQVAVIAAAAWVGAGAGGLLTAGSFAANAAAASVAVLGNLAINMLVPVRQPTIGTAEAPDAFNTLTGSRNAARIYEPVMMLFGEHRVTFDLYGTVVQETVGDEIYLRIPYCLGPAPVAVEDWKIGETALSDYEGVELETRLTADAPPHTLYTDDPVQTSVGAEINTDWTVRTTALDADEIEVVVGFLQGLGKINKKGRKVAASVTFELQYKLTTDTVWRNWRGDVTAANAAVLEAGGDSRLNYLQTFTFDNFHARLITQPGASNAPLTVTRSDPGAGFQVPFRFAVPRGQYDVRIRRTTVPSEETELIDAARFEILSSFTARDPFPEKSLASAVLRIKASDQLSGVVDTFNGLMKRLTPKFTSAALADPASATAVMDAAAPSRNPAELALWAMRGHHAAIPKADDEIDWPAWARFQNWCDSQALHFDEVITSEMSRGDLLERICAAGFARPVKDGGRLSVVIDRPRDGEPPVQTFTPRNMSGFKLTKTWPEEVHAVRGRFANRDNGYQADEVTIYADGYDASNATRIEILDIPGKTDADELRRVLRRYFNNAQRQLETYTFQMDVENLTSKRGDFVLVQHDAMSVGLGSAKVVALETDEHDDITAFVLDAPIETAAGVSLAVRWRFVAGQETDARLEVAAEAGITRDAANDRRFVLSSPADPDAAPQIGDLALIGETTRTAIEALVRDIQPDFEDRARLTLVTYAPERFTEDGPLPPHDPKVTLPLAARPATPQLLSANAQDREMLVQFFQPLNPAGVRVVGYRVLTREKGSAGDSWRRAASLAADDRRVSLPAGDPGVTYQVRILAEGRDAGGLAVVSDPLDVEIAAADTVAPPENVAAAFSTKVSATGVSQIVLTCTWTPTEDPEITDTEVQIETASGWAAIGKAAGSVGEVEIHSLAAGQTYTLGFVNRTRRGAVSERVSLPPITAPDTLVASAAQTAAPGGTLETSINDLVEVYGDTVSAAQSATEAAASAAASAASESASATHEANAQLAQGLAETAQAAAQTAQGLAVIAKDASETAQGISELARDAAQTAQGLSEVARDLAQSAQTVAQTARDEALAAKTDTLAAKDASQAAQAASEAAKIAAETASVSSASSAVAASASADEVRVLVQDQLPNTFAQDGTHWTDSLSGTPEARQASSLKLGLTFRDTDKGRAVVHDVAVTGNQHLAPKSYVKWVAGETWRIRVEARHVGAITSPGSNALGLAFRRATETYTDGGAQAFQSVAFVQANTWETFEFEYTLPDISGYPYLLPFAYFFGSYTAETGAEIEVVLVDIKNITSEKAAAASATASAASASSAAASETASGSHASAAQAAQTAAETARSGAQIAETSAVAARDTAQSASAAAQNSASLAAQSETASGDSASASAGYAASAASHAADAAQFSSASQSSSLSAAASAAHAGESSEIAGWLDVGASWTWPAGTTDLKGFSGFNAALSVDTDGGLLVQQTGVDSQLLSPLLSINGGRFTKVLVDIERQSGSSWDPSLFYTTASHGFSGSYSVDSRDVPPVGARVTAIYDMDDLFQGGDDWVTNTITRLRIDGEQTLTNAVWKIHSIRVVGPDTGAVADQAQAAVDAASVATTKADDAETSASAATTAKVAAESARDTAAGHASAASAAANTATTKATEAGQSASAAQTAQTASETSAANAATSAGQASNAETNADGSAQAAAAAAATAAGHVTSASGFADAAASEASSASGYADAAQTAASAASQSSVTAAANAVRAATNADVSGWLDVGKSWTWPAGTSDLQGWSVPAYAAGSLAVAADGGLVFTSTGGSTAIVNGTISIEGARFYKAIVDVENISLSSYTLLNRAYYRTAGHGYTGDYYAVSRDAEILPVGERRSLVFDLDALVAGGDDWLGETITGFRFDLGNNAVSGEQFKLHGIRIVGPDMGAVADQAQAAVDAASVATAKATEAGQSASAAQTAQTASETSAANAATSAGQASTAETNADGSAQAAAASAATAAGHVSSASGFADAAASEASLAEVRADAALQSAATAQSAANTATTKAGEASTAASQAATSETNADGSASVAAGHAATAAGHVSSASGFADAAASSAITAASHSSDAAQSASAAQETNLTAQSIVQDALPFDFRQDGTHWTTVLDGAPGERTSYPIYAGVTFEDSDVGRIAVIRGDYANTRVFGPKGLLVPKIGETHRIEMEWRWVPDSAVTLPASKVRLYFRRLDATGVFLSQTTVSLPVPANNEWVISTFDHVTDNAAYIYLNPFVQVLAGAGFSAAGRFELRTFKSRNITAEKAAAASATASANSAATATTKADDASQSAATAQSAANTATTKAGEASTAASQAATSETNADGSASVAAGHAATAAGHVSSASGFADAAASEASAASGYADDAETAASASQTAKVVAESARDAASGHASAASAAANTATTKATEAGQSASAAQTAQTASETAASNAATSAGQASTAQTNADGSAQAAAASQAAAQGHASSASGYADAAASEASAASGYADDAETAASASQTAKVAAESARDTASGHASAASGSAATASSKADDSEAAAAASATAQTAAETAQSNAETFAGQASGSAGSAASAASTAGTHAANAAGSAGTATTAAATATEQASLATQKASLAARRAGGVAFSWYGKTDDSDAEWANNHGSITDNGDYLTLSATSGQYVLEAAKISIPKEIAAGYAGKKIKVRVEVKTGTSSEFAVVYGTSVGTTHSGFRTFTPTGTKTWFEFEYDVPELVSYIDHFVTVKADTSVSGKTIELYRLEIVPWEIGAAVAETASALDSAEATIASLQTSVSANAAGVATNASAISSAQGSIASLQASVATANSNIAVNATAIDTLTSASAILNILVEAAGSNPAYAELLAGVGGSAIRLAADVLALSNTGVGGTVIDALKAVNGNIEVLNKLTIGGDDSFVFDPVARVMIIDDGSFKEVKGLAFGQAGSQCSRWRGPSAIAISNITRTNGIWAEGTDGEIYFGNAKLTNASETTAVSGLDDFISAGSGGTTWTTLATVSFAAIGATGFFKFPYSLMIPGPGAALTSGTVFNGNWRVVEDDGSVAVLASGSFTVNDEGGGLLIVNGYGNPPSLYPNTKSGAVDVRLQIQRASGTNNVTGLRGSLAVEWSPAA